MIVATFDETISGWRETARRLLASNFHPDDVLWSKEPTLFSAEIGDELRPKISVPKAFLELAEVVSCHRDDAKWEALYRVLYRIANGEQHLLAIESDPDINRLYTMRKQVTRDMHRMKAFVRFREVDGHYVAWHRPDHLVLEVLAPWFARRFGSMRWSILTPDRSVNWDLSNLHFGPGVPVSEAPSEDALEELWKAYYASAFNPARVNERSSADAHTGPLLGDNAGECGDSRSGCRSKSKGATTLRFEAQIRCRLHACRSDVTDTARCYLELPRV